LIALSALAAASASAVFVALGFGTTLALMRLYGPAGSWRGGWSWDATIAIAVPSAAVAALAVLAAATPVGASRRRFVWVVIALACAGSYLHRVLLVGDRAVGTDGLLVLNLNAVTVAALIGWYCLPLLRRLALSNPSAATMQRPARRVALALWMVSAACVAAVPFSSAVPQWHPFAPDGFATSSPWTAGPEAPRLEASRDDSGAWHGHWLRFHTNGKHESEGDYDHGRRVGWWQWWDDEGNPVRQGSYRDDKEDGSWVTWHNGRQLDCRDPAKRQHLRCRFVGTNRWDNSTACPPIPSGAVHLQSAGAYVLGERNGPWIFWHEGGEVAASGDYLDDRPHGEWAYWNPDGSVRASVVWAYGAQRSCKLGKLPDDPAWPICEPTAGPVPRCLREAAMPY
jgi:hypothetical protein